MATRADLRQLIQQMDTKLHFPGLSNTWTMPVENRLDMELTGIKTPVGLKVQGPSSEGIEQRRGAYSEHPLSDAGSQVGFRRTRRSGVLH